MKIYGDKQIIATLGDRGGFCTRFWRDFDRIRETLDPTEDTEESEGD